MTSTIELLQINSWHTTSCWQGSLHTMRQLSSQKETTLSVHTNFDPRRYQSINSEGILIRPLPPNLIFHHPLLLLVGRPCDCNLCLPTEKASILRNSFRCVNPTRTPFGRVSSLHPFRRCTTTWRQTRMERRGQRLTIAPWRERKESGGGQGSSLVSLFSLFFVFLPCPLVFVQHCYSCCSGASVVRSIVIALESPIRKSLSPARMYGSKVSSSLSHWGQCCILD